MTSEAGDKSTPAAAARVHLRASHADREQVVEVLKTAFVQGRLTRDELDLRVSETLASRTYGDLAALTADLPTGLARAQPPGQNVPAPAQPPTNKALLWGSWAVLLITVGFMLGTLPISLLLAGLGVLPLLIAGPIAGTLALDAWREKHSRGQLPPGSAQSRRALEDERDSGIGDDLTLAEARTDARAGQRPGHGVVQRHWQSLRRRRDMHRPGRVTVAA